MRKMFVILFMFFSTAVMATSDLEVCHYIANGNLIKDIYQDQEGSVCPKTENELSNQIAKIDAETEIFAERVGKTSINFKHWAKNYFDFLCAIRERTQDPEISIYYLDMFLTYRISKDYEHKIGGKYNLTKEDIRNFTSFVLNDPERKGFNFTPLLILGKYYYNPIFIKSEVDSELKNFIMYINNRDFIKAWNIVLDSNRTARGYLYLKSFCNRISKQQLFK